MAILSDARLLESIYDKKLVISPFVYSHLQPSSIDLTLDNIIKIPENMVSVNPLEPTDSYYTEERFETYTLMPGHMILAQIKENITIPRDFMAKIFNRSSMARLGLDVASASYINPAYSGQLPIVIKNCGTFKVELIPGMRICQLVVMDVSPSPIRDYSQRHEAKYFGESNDLVSKLHLDEELVEYSKFSKKSKEGEKASLTSFLESRLKEKAAETLDLLSNKAKKDLGIG